MSLGDKAFELVKSLKNSPETLPPFDEDTLRLALNEVNVLHEETRRDVELHRVSDGNVPPEIHVRLAAMERNRRCVLAYLYNRLRTVRSFRWGFGSIVPPEIRSNMRDSEVKWLESYGKLLAKYMCTVGHDLTQNLDPPSLLHRQVLCKKDFGEYETSDGNSVLLKKNSYHMLLDADADALLQQGIVEYVNVDS
jgi:GINS complex subunit 1